MLIARGPYLVVEWYDLPQTAREPLLGLSMTKSVISLLLAQAVASGTVGSLDDPVTRYLPELADRDARWRAVSLRALDDMRAVIDGPGDRSAPLAVAARWYLSGDLRQRLIALEPDPAGQAQFRYHSGATQLVAAALEAATGHGIEQLFLAGVWQPLGAESPARWNLDRADGGAVKAFCCLSATARDWLRLGQAFAGADAHARIVPSALRHRLRAARPAERYRAGWIAQPAIDAAHAPAAERRCLASDARIAAVGWLGQTLLVDPAQGIVALRIGERGDWRHWPLLTTLLACGALGADAVDSAGSR